MSPAEVNDLLDAVARVLLRCLVIGILILLLPFSADAHSAASNNCTGT